MSFLFSEHLLHTYVRTRQKLLSQLVFLPALFCTNPSSRRGRPQGCSGRPAFQTPRKWTEVKASLPQLCLSAVHVSQLHTCKHTAFSVGFGAFFTILILEELISYFGAIEELWAVGGVGISRNPGFSFLSLLSLKCHLLFPATVPLLVFSHQNSTPALFL